MEFPPRLAKADQRWRHQRKQQAVRLRSGRSVSDPLFPRCSINLYDRPARVTAFREINRVVGPTDEISGFTNETADYRSDDTFLYNASWRFLDPENLGTWTGSALARGGVLEQRLVVRAEDPPAEGP
jgi:hypothetical protein